MIFIGGFTRLSDAGLSIVEWKPVTGILPPLSDGAWVEEFAKYQSTPEYLLVNRHMDIGAFKKIFLIEYTHRIAARLTGIIICLPLIFFYISGRLPFRQNKSYLLMPLLLFAQGFMGWYMVKSGLKLEPHVSHFRLSAHLMLAVALYSVILWKLFYQECRERNLQKQVLGFIALTSIYIQMFLGGLVAGLDAGLIYNTFPLMGDSFIPEEFRSSSIIAMWSDPSSVQFLHRCGAYVVTICSVAFAWSLKTRTELWIAGLWIVIAVAVQVLTGIATLLLVVPISLALLHQLLAVALLSSVLYALTA